jgi:hypothetical protein
MYRGFLKLIGSISLLGGYLFALALLAWTLTSNLIAFVLSIVGGGFAFAVLAAITIAHVPVLKVDMAALIQAVDVYQRIVLLEVRWQVEGSINDFRERVDNEVKGLLPYPMELKWVMSKEDVKEYLDQKRSVVIVRMKPHDEEDWNMATATLAYVSIGLVHQARRHMRRSLSRAIDFAFSKKLLEDVGQNRAANYLVDMEVLPHVTKDGELRNYYQKLDIIAEELLTRVFLREVGNIALKKPLVEAFALESDILSLLDWSCVLAQRGPGTKDEAPFWFGGKYLKVGCVLVADPEVYSRYGCAPYLRRIQDFVLKGADAIYILARGANIDYAIAVSKEAEESQIGLTKVPGSDRRYRVKLETGPRDAIAILLRPVRLGEAAEQPT